jgi:hypothetical protein
MAPACFHQVHHRHVCAKHSASKALFYHFKTIISRGSGHHMLQHIQDALDLEMKDCLKGIIVASWHQKSSKLRASIRPKTLSSQAEPLSTVRQPWRCLPHNIFHKDLLQDIRHSHAA